MNTTTARLLPGATNVAIQDTKDNQTTITYNAPPWNERKQCIHKLPGQWQIQSINKHLVTLFNHDIIIKEDEIYVLEKNLDTYLFVCSFDDVKDAKEYAQKFGYCVTVNGVFI